MFRLKSVLQIMFACAAVLPLATFWYWSEQTTAASTANNVEEKHLVQARLLKASLSSYRNDFSEALLAQLSENNAKAGHSIAGLQKGFGLRFICAVNADNTLSPLNTTFGYNCPDKITDSLTQDKISRIQDRTVEFLPRSKSDSGNSDLTVLTRVHDVPILASISIQIFTHLGSSVNFGKSAHALITDSLGNLLYHPDPDQLTEGRAFNPFEQQENKTGLNRDGVIEYTDGDGQQMIAGYATEDATRWVVYVTQPFDEVTALSRTNRNGAIMIALSCLLVVFLLVIIFVRDLSRPLENVIRVANGIDHEGDLQQVVISRSWRTPQEVRELQVHFNTMISKLSISVGKVKRVAYTDLVTEGLNRQAFTRKTDIAIDAALRDKLPMVFFFVDLDDFKGVNDIHGHEAGDIYLRTIYTRMAHALTELVDNKALLTGKDKALLSAVLQDDCKTPIISRIGGDEFAAFFPFDGSDHELEAAMAAFQRAISAPIPLGDESVGVGTSIGVARMPLEGITQSQIAKDADTAMYSAKKGGKNRVVIFDQSLGEATAQLGAEAVAQAFETEQFSVAYTPRLRVYDRKIIGVSVSLIWLHPNLGAIDAKEFLPQIQTNELLDKLGMWMIDKVLQDCEAFPTLKDVPSIALALPQKLLTNEDFVMRIEHLLRVGPLLPNQIELMVPEEGLARQPANLRKFASHLRKSGFKVAIKNFGCGTSAMVDVGAIDCDVMTLDRNLVAEIGKNHRTKIVIESIIDMAHRLGVHTIAEGVDDEAAMISLHTLGCQSMQGRYVCQPLCLEQFMAWHEAQPLQAKTNVQEIAPKGHANQWSKIA